MGKFINTQYFDTVDRIVDMNKDLIQNPLYLFSDKKATKVKYYNINQEKSTLDPGSKLQYTDIGDNSPIRFNVIYDLYIYQFIKGELDFNFDDFGLEAAPLSADSFILPNTITPTEGDFFEVDHIKDSTWLFKVTDVNRDTLENGNNVWRITWQLDRTTNKDILKNVVEEYKYINVQNGTNIKSVVQLTKYDTAKELDDLSSTLKSYFAGLFYSDKVQTFIYKYYTEQNMYDPFVIEFMIRNRLLEDGDNRYIHVMHQAPVPKTFAIDYNRTIYRAFELKDKCLLSKSHYLSTADYIDCPTTLFYTRYEDYYQLNYQTWYSNDASSGFTPKEVITVLDDDLLNRIQENKLYDKNNGDSEDLLYKNIFIKYFNERDIKTDDIKYIHAIDFETAKDIFYITILLIFFLDYYTKYLLS